MKFKFKLICLLLFSVIGMNTSVKACSPSTGLSCKGYKTFTQGGWGANCSGSNPGCYRDAHFNATFPDGVVIGCAAGHTLSFTTSAAVALFLPTGGAAGVLSSSAINPTTSSAGVLAGQVLALTLSVEFDKSDTVFSAAKGYLYNQIININGSPFKGMTIAQFLSIANDFIGGCSSTYSAPIINSTATTLNENYDNGTVDKGNCICPASPSVSVTTNNNVCPEGNTGAVSLNVTGGVAPYAYSWSNGSITQNISNLVSGTYSVTIRDANNATVTATATVTAPVALSISETHQNIVCYGALTGSVILSATGGTGTKTWSKDGINFQASSTFSALASGSYTFTVKDANGCTSTKNVTITQPSSGISISETHTNVNCYGASSGSVTLTATGCTGSYTWSKDGINFQTSSTFSGLGAGSYTFTVKDANGCTSTKSVTITQPASGISVSETHINVNCYGATTGSVTLTATGCTGSYTWSKDGINFQASSTFSGLGAGSYTFTVKDANGCTSTKAVTITQPTSGISINETHINVNCYGASTGSVTLTATGCTGSYTWSKDGINFQASSTFSGLGADSYTFTVKDANGCTSTKAVTITQPSSGISINETHANVNCYGASTGSVTLTATGCTGSYTWSKDGINFQTSSTFSGLGAGSYTFTVKDANGCTSTKTVTITQPVSGISVSETHTNVNCYGATTGSVTLTATGCTGSFTWSKDGINFQTSSTFSALSSGSYTFTVKDANGCTSTKTVVINQPSAALSTVITSQTNVLCYWQSTGSVTLSSAGGTSPFNWSKDGINFQSSSTFSSLAAGTYSIITIDANSCTTTNSVTITRPSAPFTSSVASQTNVNCYGASTGSINMAGTGGVAPYTWSKDGINFQSGSVLSGLPAGSYTIKGKDANGCIETKFVTITQPSSALSSTISTQTNVSCYGASTGALSLSTSGGTAPYTYAWSNLATTSGISSLGAGTYNVTITDNHGCTATQGATVTQPSAALSSTVSSQTNVSCYGGANGAATVSASGGTAPYSYLWSNSATTSNISGLSAGKYSVTVTDANGCTSIQNIIITEPSAALSSTIGSQTNVGCYGALTGALSLSTSGGTSPYTYAWSNSATTSSISSLGAGTYNVTITDNNGCTATQSATVSQPSAALSSIVSSQTNVTCYGGSNGAATVSASGGTVPYSYLWSNSATTSNISGLSAGKYSVTVTDANGCTSIQNIIITEPSAALSSTIGSQTNVGCYGALTGALSLSTSGGTSPYTYAWSNSATTSSISSLGAGTYNVTITDNNGCTATQSATVSQPSAAVAIIVNITNVSSYGGSNGSITALVSGGTSPYTYLWSNSATTSGISNLTAGIYSVTVTDANGCSAYTEITVVQPAGSCIGYKTFTQGGWGAVPSGNNPGTYLHTNFAAAFPNGLSIGCNNKLTLTTAQSVTDFLPTGGTASALPSGTLVNPGASYGNVLAGQLVAAVLSVKFDEYDPGFSTTSSLLSNAIATTGTFAGWTVRQILYEASNKIGGCPSTYSYADLNTALTYINQNFDNGAVTGIYLRCCGTINISITNTSINCFGGNNGTATATVSGGTAPYTYRWSNNATTSAVSNLSAGTYTLTVTDASGCSQTDTVSITQPSSVLSASINPDNIYCVKSGKGSATALATGGTAPYTYSWNTTPVQTTASATKLNAGTYTVTITDAKGCTATSSVSISGEPTAFAYTSNYLTTTQPLSGNSFSFVAYGTAPGETYLWDFGDGSSSTLASPTKSYTTYGIYNVKLTATNTAGCSNISYITVVVLAPSKSMSTIANCTTGKTPLILTRKAIFKQDLTDWSGSNLKTQSVLKFDTALGILSGVKVITKGSFTTQNKVEITGNMAAGTTRLVKIQTTGTMNCGGPGFLYGITPVSIVDSFYSTGFDGIKDFAGTSGKDFGPHTSSIADSTIITTPSVLASYSGSDSVTFTAYTNTQFSAQIPTGNDTAVIRTFASDTVTVIYYYCPHVIDAIADAGTVNGFTGGTAVNNVLSNDVLNAVIVNPSQVTLSFVSTGNSGVSLSGSSVMVGSGTAAGSYKLVYRICEVANPSNCDEDTVTVTVNPPAINAVADAGTVNGSTGGIVINNVLSNDLLNSVSIDTSKITVSFVSSGNPGLTLSGKTVIVAPGTAAGTYVLIYRICEILNPSNCDQDTVTITVTPAQINAVADAGSVNGYTGGIAVNNVLSNDLLNGVAVIPSKITLSFVSTDNAGVMMNGDSISVLAGTPAGKYNVIYRICESLNPTNCDQDTAVVTVNPPAIDAIADTGSANGYTGDTAVANVLVNDLLNGSLVDPLKVTVSFVSTGNSGITLNGSSVIVAPRTAVGTYHLVYRICEILNPANCNQDSVRVSVLPCVGNVSVSATSNSSCYASQTGYASAIAFGGALPYTYLWSNSATDSLIRNLAPGTYSVTATDSKGCSATANTTVTEATQIHLSFTTTDVTCLDNTIGAAVVSLTGGTSPYTYLWDNNVTASSINSLGEGRYGITVTDANGCNTTGSATISVQRIVINSVKSGDWSDPATWDVGRVPTTCDDVHIRNLDSVVVQAGIHAYCRDILCDGGSRFYIYDTLECRDFVTDDPSHITKVFGKLKTCTMFLDHGSYVYSCSNISISNCTHKTNPLDIVNGAHLLPHGGSYCSEINIDFDLDSVDIDLRPLCNGNIGIQTLIVSHSTVTLDACNNIVDYVQLNEGGDCNGKTPTWVGVSKLAINRDYNLDDSTILWTAGTANVPHNIDVLSGTVNVLTPKTVMIRMQIVGGIVTGGTNLIFDNNSYLFRCGGVLAAPATMGTNVTVELCSDTNSNNPPAVIGGTDMPSTGFTGDVIISTNTVLGGDVIIPTGRLIVTSTGILNDSSFQVMQATAVNVESGGVVVVSNPNGISGDSSLLGSLPLTLDPNSTVIYTGDTGTQVISGVSYGTLILEDSSAKTMAGAANIAGDFIVTGGTTTTTTNSIVTFNGNGNQNLAGLTYNDVSFTGTGTKTITSEATVNSSLVVTNGVVLNTNNQLTLESNATTTAQIGPLLNGADIVGDVCWKRWIPGGSKNRRTRFMSNPIQNVTFRWWQNDIFITGPGSGGVACDWYTTSTTSMHQNSNGFDQNQSLLVNPANTSAMTCFTFNETSNTWQTIGSAFDTIRPLKAYRTFVRGDRNIEGCLLMTNMPDSVSEVTLKSCGPVVKFTQTAQLTFTAGIGNGWNYVSNPYPCAINWWDPTWVSLRSSSINSTLYIYDPVKSQYATWNPIAGGTNGGTNIIGTGQSFFIKTNALANLVFEEMYKVDSGQIGFFGKGNASMATANKVKIIMQGVGTSDETVVYLHPNATLNFEDKYDGYKMGYSTGSIASSTKMNTAKLVFSGIAPVSTIDTIILNTNISATTASYTLTFNGINTFESQYVLLLKDKYLNTVTNLLTNRTYTFGTATGVAASYNQNRFELIIMNASSLPVTLSDFTAEKKEDKTVLVKWSTASETNNSHFIVEHSVDGSSFKPLEVVKGAGNSNSVKNYAYLHTNPVHSINYYRLTQVDQNSIEHESYVVAIDMSEDQLGTITLFPVPAENILNIGYNNSRFSGNVTVKIFDMVGREVISKQMVITGTNQVSTLDVSGLMSGSYFISITSPHGVEQNLKFIKN